MNIFGNEKFEKQTAKFAHEDKLLVILSGVVGKKGLWEAFVLFIETSQLPSNVP